MSDERQTWTFKLARRKFHDGSDFDANDVVYTFKRFWDPELHQEPPPCSTSWIRTASRRSTRIRLPSPPASNYELPVLITNESADIVAERRQARRSPAA